MTIPEHFEDQIQNQLHDALGDITVDIIDHTHQHLKHRSHQAGTLHLELKITAPHLSTTNRINRDRQVYDALAEWIPTHIHSVIITWI